MRLEDSACASRKLLCLCVRYRRRTANSVGSKAEHLNARPHAKHTRERALVYSASTTVIRTADLVHLYTQRGI